MFWGWFSLLFPERRLFTMFVSAWWEMCVLHRGLLVSLHSEPTLAPHLPLEVASLAGSRPAFLLQRGAVWPVALMGDVELRAQHSSP